MVENRYDGYNRLSVAALAFTGDAVWEVFVRRRCLALAPARAASASDCLHEASVRYVRAGAQALALQAIRALLTEEELDLVRRARNRKPKYIPRNADIMEYKWATAFEAFVGWLYLMGDDARLGQICEAAAEAIERG